MSVLLSQERCPICEEPFAFGELIVPLWRITHKGANHTEADETNTFVHVACLR